MERLTIWNGVAAALAGLVFGILGATLFPFTPAPWMYLEPALPLVVFLIVQERPRLAFILAASAGIATDAFAVEFSSFAVGRLLCIAALLVLLARTQVTNQSLYANLALVIAARLLSALWLFTASWFNAAAPFHALAGAGWSRAWKTGIWDAVIILVLFLLVSMVFRRFVVSRRSASRSYGGS